ncbi:maltose operon protein MalM [Pasteurella skyensis]|uniref:Maltose operon protein MalM n=1 Tax=Phocoenobacter skyensis TaxID=97481 RepID=A0AAJ6N9K7_9PAST|nr:maltose operon protein MalM [Pasteurella skyensis]MDP8162266.1 maltose operon protein MalM [Pasteurella skyensis]MDP8172730.1 maltose operon protein MalM [Pasteurella skyensis]MDP8176892.1 maltose operon protein MalM [Pasteurella skyensis]MDP8179230.1 maltose operon protein MalM [Pasteurella skyensis]MDP8183315.1 maltose operon protein MalM [Pasteurella skyensis]
MKNKITLLISTFFAVSALASPFQLDQTKLQNLNWQNVNLSQQQVTDITSNQVKHFISSLAGFDSAVIGYKIPANQGTIKVNLSSLVVDNDHIFVPNMLVLDANFNPSVTYPASTFKLAEARGLDEPQLTAQLSLTPTANQDYLYLLIYTTKQDLAKTTTITHPAKLYAKAKGNQPPAINDIQVKHTNFGKIKIDIDGVQTSQFIGLNGPLFEAKQPQATVVGKQQKVAPKRTQKVENSTEQYFNNAVLSALKNNDISKAMNLVNEAEQLGLTQPRKIFLKKVAAKK